MTRLGLLAFLSLVLLPPGLAVSACHPSSSSSETPAASASAAPSTEPSSAPVASASPGPSASGRPPPPRCRAVSVSGTSTLTPLSLPTDAGPGAIVAESADLPDDVWIDLQKGAKLTARHPHSTRETTFIGPGRVRSCVAHSEEAWVAQGTFDSVPSSGERPGAEEWVITPLGVVRYASAHVEIDVKPQKTDVKLTSGSAYVWTDDHPSSVTPPPAQAGIATQVADGWTRLEGTAAISFTPKSAAKTEDAAKAAVLRCTEAAKASKNLAMAIAGPDASLAQIAPRHVMARHIARASCDVALLRVGLLPPSAVRDGFTAELKEAEGDWRAGRTRPGHGRRP
jgi:hypothetical protein